MRSITRIGLVVPILLPLAALQANRASAEGVVESSPPYCATLAQIADLAASIEKFASITGRERQGDFSDTTLALPGWTDCSIYGPRTYTCDSPAFATSEETEKAIEAAALEIAVCPGKHWVHSAQQSSSSYVVLVNPAKRVSMTLSAAQNDSNQFVMRLILFARRE